MDFIKFLGTAGARIVVSKQLRASGGIWICLDGTNIHLDPGPGALVRCVQAKPKLDPLKLDALILSHRHLDHAADINVMIEAMTEGGRIKKGKVFCPKDALEDDPVILKYIRGYPEEIVTFKAGKSYEVGNISFNTPLKHIHHGSETYGINFKGKKHTISYISDTKFFPELIKKYSGDVVILNVLRATPFKGGPIDHLTLEDAKKVIKGIKPKTAILTHFGGSFFKVKPWEAAEEIAKELKIEVIAARDGMTFNL